MNSPPVPDDVLSAYLADDLPDGEAAALEARLPGDPELAARLDRMAEVLVELGGLDHATPPSGFDARLAERLRTERELATAGSGDGAGRLAPAPVADLDQIRRRRAVRQRRWVLGGTVAAGVAAVALVSGLALQGFMVGGGGESAGGAVEEAAGPVPAQGGGAAADAGTGASTEAGEESAVHGTPSGASRPVVVDREVVLADEAAVRARYRALVEAQRLLAVPLPQARGAADSAEAFLRQSPRLNGGVAPDECLSALPRDNAGPVVPARVETVVYRGEPALAYVLVGASDGASALDRIRVRILRREDCSTALSLRL
ncbi:MAG: hypothetical protein M3524_12200 [Actinomycetota bacterium]|nr:hypothetical protein [Actinomycetota bacterium]